MRYKTENTGVKFLFALAMFVLMLTGTLSAVEFQAGLSLVSLSESEEHKSETAITPTVALRTAVDEKIFFKLELGYLNYSVERPGEKFMPPGEIGVAGFSAAGIFSYKLRNANLYAGGGIIRYAYDGEPSAKFENLFAEMGYAYKEEINPAVGRQLIFGVDGRLNDNLAVGLDYRIITVKPKFTGTIHYAFNGQKHLSFAKEVDFSHSWLGLNITYTF